MIEICIFSGAFLVTYFGVAWFRNWSLKRGVLDHPNERSSHVEPTPRGGGLVIAVVVLVVYVGASFFVGYDLSIGFAVGAVLVVLISWLDDVYSVSFKWRLLVHSIAAALVIYSCGYVTSLPSLLGGPAIEIGKFGILLTFGWIVWVLNAYNFMDGIDGIAGMQAVTAAIGWIMLSSNSNSAAVFVLGGTVLFSAIAFLLHNWPPARIFMGDAGSAFLGFVFAVMPLLATRSDPSELGTLFLAAVAFLWLFVFDSVLTFLRRAFRREKVWQAHREHLYQRMVRSGMSHLTTNLIYGAVSIVVAVTTSMLIIFGNPRATLITNVILIGAAGVIVIICWRRRCLFGEVS